MMVSVVFVCGVNHGDVSPYVVEWEDGVELLLDATEMGWINTYDVL